MHIPSIIISFIVRHPCDWPQHRTNSGGGWSPRYLIRLCCGGVFVTLTLLVITVAKYKVGLQPLGAILPWYTWVSGGFLNWVSIMPRDASLSLGWTWDLGRCSWLVLRDNGTQSWSLIGAPGPWTRNCFSYIRWRGTHVNFVLKRF